MSFIVKNDGFKCEYCGEKNPPAPSTCRNHCKKCLCSKHVDDVFPGDRKSACGGKMKPISVLKGNKKSDFVILFQCEKCQKKRKNRMAPDDNISVLFTLSHKEIYG